LRLPFSSPPTTRRVTVKVFEPASKRACPNLTFYCAFISGETRFLLKILLGNGLSVEVYILLAAVA
jgi:hypothetical protein